jgi:hypothetical protein
MGIYFPIEFNSRKLIEPNDLAGIRQLAEEWSQSLKFLLVKLMVGQAFGLQHVPQSDTFHIILANASNARNVKVIKFWLAYL